MNEHCYIYWEYDNQLMLSVYFKRTCESFKYMTIISI